MAKKEEEKMTGREFSSGGVVYRKDGEGKTFFLICKSNPSSDYPSDYWRLPKGWIDDSDGGINPGPKASGVLRITNEDLQKTAIREVKEEGGVVAKIIKKINTVKYFYKHKKRGQILKFVTYYLMKYQKNWPQGFGFETEKTEWLKFSDAYQRLNNKNEKEVLKEANALLIKLGEVA